ncbi:sugar ABC transporter permease [Paenibacillus sp. 19GGS1-52]|uniref:carbohydrate ABC transporter permease n=1 Tax=Paenibacillus sp. 19GGS1-52 TaxID=2758563 RepID=UPI0031F3202D
MRNKTAEGLRQTVFMGPAIIVFAIVVFFPFIYGIYFSMTDWNGISIGHSWVGLDNYKYLLKDTDFLRAFWLTARIAVVITLLMNIAGFGVALLLTRKLRYRNLYRTAFFLPNVLGGLVLGFVWQFIFTKGFELIGEKTGWTLFGIPWLGNSTTAFWALVIVSVWQGMGYVMVIYITGLSGISTELLEAAQVDRASTWVILTRIKLPLIMSSITVCLFWTINVAFKIFDLNISLTNGGPFRSTEFVTLNIYNEAFRNSNFGLGSAKAVTFFIAVALITSIQAYLTKRKEVEA